MDSSLLTAVLVGVILLWLLSERYGWPSSGLVVPGYLAGVFAIHPVAGAVVVVEAAITWVCTAFMVKVLPRVVPVDAAFGRERFFLTLLVSIGVRLVVEGGPAGGLLSHLGIELDSSIHSLGLVLVPLTANAMWRSGFWKGIPLTGIPTLLVYLLLRFVLLPHTNLSFASFELTYENLALDFISSPRAYILILSGTFLATIMSGRFGWDTGGILIPGLLAIVWMDPARILTTVLEVAVIVFLLRGALSLPYLSRVNLTGMRPMMLAFAMAYLVKLLLAWSLGDRYPGLRVTELFGFGYLLPALVAVRCWRHHSIPRVVLPGLIVSGMGWLLGTSIGSGLEALRTPGVQVETTMIAQRPGPAWRAVVDLALPPAVRPDPTLDAELRDAWHMALMGRPLPGDDFRVESYADGTVLHSGDRSLQGTAWVRSGAGKDVAVIVPGATEDAGLAEAGVALAETLDARILLLSPGRSIQALAAATGVARVELVPGPEDRFSLARRRVDPIDTGRLTRILPLAPTWDLSRDAGVEARITLSEESILTLALRRFEAPVLPGRVPLYQPDVVPGPEEERGYRTPAGLMALHRGVMLPLLKAVDGDPRWLLLAAAGADRRGMVVAMDDEVVSLGPKDSRETPRYGLWIRREGGAPVVFEVRAAGREHLAAQVARAWWAGTGGRALLVHDAGADLDSLAVQRAGTASPELVVLRSLVLDRPGSTVVSVGAWREDEYPGADAVISTGRPIGPHDVVPDWLEPVRALVEGAGGTVAFYDGAFQRLRFYEPSNPRPDAMTMAGGQYAAVYLSPEFRARFAVPDHSGAMRSFLEANRIPMEEASLAALMAHPLLDEETALALFGSSLEALARLRQTGHPGELARLGREARARRLQQWAFTDPDDGLPYLVLEGSGALLVTPFTRASGELAPPDADPSLVRLEGLSVALRGGGP